VGRLRGRLPRQLLLLRPLPRRRPHRRQRLRILLYRPQIRQFRRHHLLLQHRRWHLHPRHQEGLSRLKAAARFARRERLAGIAASPGATPAINRQGARATASPCQSRQAREMRGATTMTKPRRDDNAAKLAERDARKWRQGMEKFFGRPVRPEKVKNYRRAREEFYHRKGK